MRKQTDQIIAVCCKLNESAKHGWDIRKNLVDWSKNAKKMGVYSNIANGVSRRCELSKCSADVEKALCQYTMRMKQKQNML